MSEGAKKYRVCGPHAVLGHQPGETFEAEIPPDQEARALERGSLETVANEPDEFKGLSRDQLNAIAEDSGVEDAESLPNKPAVIEAIENAREGNETKEQN